MKKTLAFLLALALMLGLLAGCGEQETAQTPETTEPARSDSEMTLEALSDWQTLTGLPNRANGSNGTKDHTLMIYMVGSDLEQKHKLATIDLNEIRNSGVDLQKNNVLVYTGGTAVWHSNIPSEVNTIQELTLSGFEAVAATEHAVSTGDPSTLLDFLNFSVSNYPAKEYSLIFWDHGSGSLFGFGVDQLFNKDGLYLQEIGLALQHSPFKNQKLRFVGFDACLLATAEMAATLKPYANYMIASEETEPGEGWNYASLKDLNKDMPTFAATVLRDYEIAMRADRFRPDYSLSCLDLSKTDQLLEAMDGLFGAARNGIVEGNYSAIAQARIKAKTYGLEGVKDIRESLDMIDLGHMGTLLGSLYAGEAQALTTAISQMVVCNVTNIENTNGVSVYFPHHNTSLAINGGLNLYKQTATSTGYQEFLDVYTDMLFDGKLDVQWETNKPAEEKEDGLYMEFTLNEQKNIGRIYCNIFKLNEADSTYSPVLSQYELELENGRIRVPLDPMVVVATTDLEGQKDIFHFTRPTGDNYISELALFMASNDVLTGGIEPIQIELRETAAGLEIASIISRDQSNSIYSLRANVSPDYWAKVAYMTYSYTPDETTATTLPYDQWTTDGSYTIYNFAYAQDFGFALEPLSAQEGQFYVQLCVEDTRGQLACAAFEPLSNYGEFTVETVTTELGAMTFHVYADHAKMVHYEGEDAILTIPATVGGQPVTVIGTDAARRAYGLTEVVLPNSVLRLESGAFGGGISKINLPKGLQYIGDSALSGYKGTELTLPQSVTYLGFRALSGSYLEKVTLNKEILFVAGDAFSGSHQLTAIEMKGKGVYQSVDGVLFTADGLTLVTYPAGGSAEYTVPMGVTTIGYGAFSNNYKNLKKVTLPEGLLTIDHLAFAYCEQLTDLVLPESLTYIGHSAFGTDVGMPKGTGVSTIHIGPNVEFIGIDAFNSFNLTAYTVDPMNLSYSASENGCLLNFAGTQLIAAPCGYTGSFEVPYGVCLMDWHCLQDCNGMTELILPDTVAYIDLGAGCPNALEKLVIGSGLVYWGNQKDFENVPTVEISPDNPFLNQNP